ncbi:MAG: FxLYD domain-containing protein [Candidatus Pacebacteria bacterium]|nr:FxLYD domain-containing protein [Candidatus Paceibacterota bacterium]
MTKGQRFIKKMFIVIIILLVLVGLYLILFPNKPDTCLNKVLDVGEERVDCGGVCSKKCPLIIPDVSEIEVVWVDFIQDGENRYDLVAKILNKNSSWGIYSVYYRFVIYDNAGNVTKTDFENTYIMPKGFLKEEGKKYVIENNYVFNSEIEKVEIEFEDYDWREVKDALDLAHFNFKIIEVEQEDHGFPESIFGDYYVFGVAKNTSKYTFDRVDISVVLFDQNNRLVATGKTNHWTLESDEKREFKIFWKNPIVGEVDYIDYIAQTNIFASGSNLLDDITTGKEYETPR